MLVSHHGGNRCISGNLHARGLAPHSDPKSFSIGPYFLIGSDSNFKVAACFQPNLSLVRQISEGRSNGLDFVYFSRVL